MATHPIPIATTSVNGFGAYADVLPGDVLELTPGTRGTLTISNIIGTSAHPIIIQNGNGVSDINTSSGWVGIWMTNCRYIHFTGAAYGQTYGIKFTKCIGFGILGNNKTDNIEIDHVEVLQVISSGQGEAFHIITTATTSPDYDYNGDGYINSADGVINRNNYTLSNIKLHHCHVNGGVGDDVAMFCYIGNSNYCEDTNEPASQNIEVYNNLIEHTSDKALQVGSVISGLKVHDNTLLSVCSGGDEGIAININAGIGGEVYNNWIQDATGVGIYYQTAGGKIYNNVIVDCGRNQGTYGSGITVDYRYGYSHSQNLQIIENTIIRPLHYGINYVDNYGVNTSQNNIIVAPGSGYISGGDVDSDNLKTMDIADCGFVNAAGDNYHLDTGSPAINAGADISAFGITFDMDNNPRPYNAYDQGAYEVQSGVPPTPPSVSVSYGPSAWMVG